MSDKKPITWDGLPRILCTVESASGELLYRVGMMAAQGDAPAAVPLVQRAYRNVIDRLSGVPIFEDLTEVDYVTTSAVEKLVKAWDDSLAESLARRIDDVTRLDEERARSERHLAAACARSDKVEAENRDLMQAATEWEAQYVAFRGMVAVTERELRATIESLRERVGWAKSTKERLTDELQVAATDNDKLRAELDQARATSARQDAQRGVVVDAVARHASEAVGAKHAGLLREMNEIRDRLVIDELASHDEVLAAIGGLVALRTATHALEDAEKAMATAVLTCPALYSEARGRLRTANDALVTASKACRADVAKGAS